VAEFDRRGWVRNLANYWVMGWDRCKLRWCTGLGEDDRCSVLENSPLLCHLATRKEELFKIGVV
jgi:Fe-S-cluster containining protein